LSIPYSSIICRDNALRITSESAIFGAQQYAPLLDIEVLVQRAVVLAELEEATERFEEALLSLKNSR
jgi:hypothetical protein